MRCTFSHFPWLLLAKRSALLLSRREKEPFRAVGVHVKDTAVCLFFVFSLDKKGQENQSKRKKPGWGVVLRHTTKKQGGDKTAKSGSNPHKQGKVTTFSKSEKLKD